LKYLCHDRPPHFSLLRSRQVPRHVWPTTRNCRRRIQAVARRGSMCLERASEPTSHPAVDLADLATNENTKRWLSSHRPAEMEMSVRRQIYITLDEAMLAVKLHTSALQRSLVHTSNT
jgi:hypothetical protein